MRKIRLRYWSYFFLISILLIIIICCTSCSAKSITRKSPVAVKTDLPKVDKSKTDSTIKSAIQKIDSCDEIELQIEIITLAQSLSDCQEENENLYQLLAEKPKEKETIIVDKSRTKYKKSFNDTQKNSNNQTEVIKLKNSILVKDSAIANLEAENLALNGKIKDLTKITPKKGSVVGNDNEVDNSKKLAWWWVFLAGMLTWCLLQNFGFRFLKTYFPFLKFLP